MLSFPLGGPWAKILLGRRRPLLEIALAAVDRQQIRHQLARHRHRRTVARSAAALALIEFATLDKKPVIEAGNTKPMAMFHDIDAKLGVQF